MCRNSVLMNDKIMFSLAAYGTAKLISPSLESLPSCQNAEYLLNIVFIL